MLIMLPGPTLYLALSRGNVAYSSPSKRMHSVEWAAAASGSRGMVFVGMRKRWGLGRLCSKTPPLEVWPRDRVGSGAKRGVCCGGVLLSHTLPGAVPSALAGLASRFGMDAGRFPAAMTTTRWFNHILLNTPTVAAGLGGVRGLCWL